MRGTSTESEEEGISGHDNFCLQTRYQLYTLSVVGRYQLYKMQVWISIAQMNEEHVVKVVTGEITAWGIGIGRHGRNCDRDGTADQIRLRQELYPVSGELEAMLRDEVSIKRVNVFSGVMHWRVQRW